MNFKPGYPKVLILLLFIFFLFYAGINKNSHPYVPSSSPRELKPTSIALTDTNEVTKGEILFKNNCAGCHNFHQRGIGPNLSGVAQEVPTQWLKKFIHNAQQVIQSGDTRGKMLFEQYNQYMPPFSSLSNADVDALLSYISIHKSTSTADNAFLGAAIKDPIPAKIPQSGLTLELEEIIKAPATAEKIPLARINKMTVLPGKKDRVFIQELRGVIYEMDNKELKIFMDIRKERPGFIDAPGLATGFGSFAFHPDFYKNGLFYTSHTEKANVAPADFAFADSIPVTLQWVLTEWKITDPNVATFAGTGREIMRVNMVNFIHGMQEITFNPLAKPGSPDYGLLYIGIGDGGAAEAKYPFICNSPRTIWSSVLRIDPLGRNSKNKQYGIPASNPFAKDNNPNTLAEIFCRGFRNPNRISWAADGKMIISDIGLTNIEELNIGKAGADYGWPAREGTFLLNYKGQMDRVYPLPENDKKFNYTYPVAQFDHDEGNAISGGFVYNSSRVPVLKDKYIFGDIVSGRVFFVENSQLIPGKQTPVKEVKIELDGQKTTFRESTGNKKTDLRFGLGLKNDLYIFTKSDGRIYLVKNCKTGSKN
ncbi:PQQ-dependent sugar dehydrogenase [Rubrolithibacter danxiaensis]|uniref:PQQ-dependent sugar dehydrogenase n=1 Tax=Rubrolithibacter danxiaensis TaxID=3390805 RepID=UPI003BF7EACC